MGEHEGFSLAPRDLLWPAIFTVLVGLFAASVGAFAAGDGIDPRQLMAMAPLLIAGALVFGVVDSWLVALERHSRTDVITVFAIDAAVWFGVMVLFAVADTGPLTWWRFVIPVLAGAAGASILDQGRGRGVMLATCVVMLAALGRHATGTPVDWASIPPFVAWPLMAAIGTFPFCAYLRLTHRRGTSLHVLGSVAAASLAMMLAFSLTWILAVRSPSARSSEVLLQRQRTASAIAADLGQRFSANDFWAKNPELTKALVLYSNAANADLYVFDTSNIVPTLLLATRNAEDGPASASRTPVALDASGLDSGELAAVTTAAGLAAPSEVGFATLRDLNRSDAAPDWRYTGGPPLAERIALHAASGPQPSPRAAVVLVAASGSNDWWRPLTAVQVAAASVGSIFPWLFYALLLPVMGSLLLISRRQDMRTKLIEAEERSRIRLDTHDKVSNRLSAVAKRIEVTAKSEETRTSQDLQAAAGDIRSAVADLQMIVGDGPPAPPAGGVLAQLEQVCASQARQRGMEVTFRAPEDLPDLPMKLKWDLQCVVEEALTNASKHGGARHADVSVELRQSTRGGRNSLWLVVSDDGAGVETPVVFDNLGAEHHGLRGIRRRATDWKGHASLGSTGARTVLSFDVQLP